MDVLVTASSTTMKSNPASIRDGLSAVCGNLRRAGVNEPALDNLELTLAEALNNIAEHAYCGDPAGYISVLAEAACGSLKCHVVDRGRAMPDENLPSGELDPFGDNVHELPEGGFGWFLIHSLTTDIKYVRLDQENHLSFRLPMSTEAN